jgi:hypothetical protein
MPVSTPPEVRVMDDHSPVSRTQRFARLAKMTASVAGTYTRSRLRTMFQSEEEAEATWQQAHADSGEVVAKTLGELKGAVMKIGQMASVAQDLLPRELAQQLSSPSSPPLIPSPSPPPPSARSTAPAPTMAATSWSRSSTLASTSLVTRIWLTCGSP